ncbi:MlaD family protein [Limobrevibacterium gyesilva]|uniref:MlaD family protein n=1 Tax=Limobrevibacterium gyesilva TaxID=2991712 RepID=A0AA41YMK1_9PROT|nr:MlaD family protein [Limobrevibacterium gyesilva]MCW3473035.1 MlaD family protein [Limobrevibacterium gyesilva]
MTSKATYLRVGLLLVAGIVAAIWLVLFLGRNRVSQGARYETYFTESVQGLEVGAPVKFRGVTLGQVNEIGLVSAAYMRDKSADPQDPTSRLVFVRFVIDPRRIGRVPDQESAIRYGLRARLASQGITGLAYVELDFVDPVRFPVATVPWEPRDTYMPSMPSTITQVQNAAQTLLARIQGVDIERLAAALQTALDDVHGQLTTGDAHAALAEAARLMKTARKGLESADLPGLAADLRATSGAVRGAVDPKATQNLLAATTQAADRLAVAAGRLPALITALEATVRRADAGTADIQADLLPVLRDARAAAANLRETSETLRRYPAAVLLGGPPPRTDGGR